jgi:hypothetical protein
MRVYGFCSQQPPPCDTISNNAIIDGDIASGHLTSSSGYVAAGVVTTTTDQRDTPLGVIEFTFDPNADTISDSQGVDFCGQQAALAGTCGA